jgi:3-hydroxyisobutyrate dehydrogenase-like beta-hydroxyacid dehydrogenase
LLEGGCEAYGYNRTPSKARRFVERGMTFVQTPRELARACDAVISMVTDGAAMDAIAEGENGIVAGLSAGKIWIEMSTISPDAIRAMNERAMKTGATLLDSAALGSPLTVRQGKLLIMLAGDEAACRRVETPLQAIAQTVRRVGEIGHAKVMKLALNLNLAVQMLAASEGLVLAEKNGIDRQTALDMLLGGALASPMLAYRAPFVTSMPEKAWFDVGMMQKDVVLALQLGRESQVPLPTAAVADEILTATRAMGLGEDDFAVMFYALARMAGLNATVSRST